jgi:hypothetical protein
MTPEEEAYDEALRRIRKAEETAAVALDLSGLKEDGYTGLETLNRLPPELTRLISLQLLDLSRCAQFSGDLAPLARLKSLHSLNLAFGPQLSDLSPLAGLASLQSVGKTQLCRRLRDWEFDPSVATTQVKFQQRYQKRHGGLPKPLFAKGLCLRGIPQLSAPFKQPILEA